jgi:hypothetical protein
MAQDTHGRSWRTFAAARLAPIKDYLQRDRDPRPTRDTPSAENGYPDGPPKRPSWSQRLARRSNSDSDDVPTMERVVLLPGWASKRYHKLPYRAGVHDCCLLFEKNSLTFPQAHLMISKSSFPATWSKTRPPMYCRVPSGHS